LNIEGLSLDQMRAALIVAESGSFSGAARRLNRKQSTLSYAVATLERQLGVALFDRTDGQRPKPTEVGRVLLLEMEAVVRRADEIKKQAQAATSGLENELSITIDAFYPGRDLAALLDGFAERFPTVQLRLTVESMGAVQERVLDGTSVLGISGGYLSLPAGLIGDAVSRVTRIPVASPRHPLAAESRAPLPRGMLLDHVQIVVSDRSKITEGRDFTVYTGRTWRVSDVALKRNLLIAGLGWGYLPDHMITEDVARGTLRRLQVEGLRERNVVALLAIRRRDRILGPAARWVLSRLMASGGRSDEAGPGIATAARDDAEGSKPAKRQRARRAGMPLGNRRPGRGKNGR
jgi:DNA-binding transcriptional LysR family regulator